MSFTELGLSEPLLRAVADLGYETPTPIQQQAIPVVLEGGDLLAGAQTGTGKTAGFTLPLLERLSRSPARNQGNGKPAIRALVLTPTRELAAQVEESVRDYGKYLKLKSMMMFGGVGIHPQIDQLRRGVDILVATPGRLLDHMQQGTVDLSQIEIFVLDEADRMLDMGFIRDIRKVLAKLPARRQNLLFSATFSDEIKSLAAGLLDAPKIIEVARRNTTAQTVDQRVYLVDRERKRELLTKLIRDNNWFQVLVFTRTKHGANRLAEQLDKDGIKALAIHGNKSQSARTRALSEFKDATLQVLVATDIAARGIDIDQLPHVVNFDLPNVPEDYVHRIGRTGRAGATGEAWSLVCIDEKQLLIDIEKVIGRSFPKEIVPGFEPDPSIKPEPIQKRGDRSGGGGRNQAPRAPQGAPRGENGRSGGGNHGGNGGGRPAAASGRGNGGSGNGGNGGGNPATPRSAPARGGAPAGADGRPAALLSQSAGRNGNRSK
ncbi:DEAD/DEAH box helicase [Robbsia sp. Bb-Pol-6]|uniref:ATP-dependent RNA helicase RhlE n=1 Tax=Robbsia betulipollinis TaxID=2981849 RepID=A0ABT3ZLG9_9BURK|nr:DEAD/DEAH box helicase [Robbsia betulipollinis]MCY0387388.1 DEAD/DEAH box helicase [Robbsia betulipollinis]